MYVLVAAGRPDDPAVAVVCEPEDLKRLHVALRDVTDAEAAAALEQAHLGTIEASDAWLDIATLGTARDDEDWQDDFAVMVAYAQKKGWVDGSGARVRAHIERG